MSNSKKKKTSGPSVDDEEPIWDFIYENICTMDLYEDVTDALFEQYLKENKKSWSVKEISDYFTTSMKPTLYKCDLPAEMMLSLFKKLEIEISAHVEEILEKKFCAVLRMDADRCLQKFKLITEMANRSKSTEIVEKPEKSVENAKNSNFSPKIPEIPPEKPSEPEPKRRKLDEFVPMDLEISAALEQQIWDYISQKSSNLTGKMVLSDEFWRESLENFVDLPIKSAQLLQHHFKTNMIEKLYMQQGMDAENKIRLIQDLHIPISMTQSEWILEKDGIRVKLTENGFIDSWKQKEAEPIPLAPPPPRLQSKISTWEPRVRLVEVPNRVSTSDQPGTSGIPPVNHDTYAYRHYRRPSRFPSPPLDVKPQFQDKNNQKRGFFSLDDQIFAWKYIFKEIYNAQKYRLPRVLPKGIVFWNEFVKKTKSTKTAANWSSHFRKKMCPTLQEMPLNRKTILYLFENIDIDVDQRVHRLLERKCDARVRLVDGMVHSYRFNDEDDTLDDPLELKIETDSDEVVPETVQIEEDVEQEGAEPQNPEAQQPGEWDIEEDMDETLPLHEDVNSEADEAIIEVMEEERAAAQELDPEIEILEPVFQKKTPLESRSVPNTPKTVENQPETSSKSAEIPRISTRITRSYAKLLLKETAENPTESHDVFDRSPQKTPRKTRKSTASEAPGDSGVVTKEPKILNLKTMIPDNPTQVLTIIQETIDEMGERAIDSVNDAIERAFKMENWDKDDTEGEEYRQLTEMVKEMSGNSQIRKQIMSSLPAIFEDTVGITPNRRMFDKRVKEMKKKVKEILKKEMEKEAQIEVEEEPQNPNEPSTSSK